MTHKDLLAQARRGLLAHRLRATLSSVGIIVGVGTVVSALAVNDGARRAAIADMERLGLDNVLVRSTTAANAQPVAPALTRQDAAAIRSTVRNIAAVAVVRLARAEVGYESRTETVAVGGVGPEWARIMNLACGRGRCLTDGDEHSAQRVAVLGSSLAQRLGRTDPLGDRITISGEVFRVVGVLANVQQRPGGAAPQTWSPDESVLVPSRVMDLRLGEGDSLERVSEIAIRLARGADAGHVAVSASGLLARRHIGGTGLYEFVIPRELLHARLRAQRTFDVMLFSTGFIALIISGIGIMNIMLASVMERHHEIGVRRAVGARRGEIVRQFAAEAALLCMMGGLVGVPVGGTFAWSVAVLAGWPVALSAGSIVLALGLAGSVGLVFGIYPAYQAASIDPIDALRA